MTWFMGALFPGLAVVVADRRTETYGAATRSDTCKIRKINRTTYMVASGPLRFSDGPLLQAARRAFSVTPLDATSAHAAAGAVLREAISRFEATKAAIARGLEAKNGDASAVRQDGTSFAIAGTDVHGAPFLFMYDSFTNELRHASVPGGLWMPTPNIARCDQAMADVAAAPEPERVPYALAKLPELVRAAARDDTSVGRTGNILVLTVTSARVYHFGQQGEARWSPMERACTFVQRNRIALASLLVVANAVVAVCWLRGVGVWIAVACALAVLALLVHATRSAASPVEG